MKTCLQGRANDVASTRSPAAGDGVGGLLDVVRGVDAGHADLPVPQHHPRHVPAELLHQPRRRVVPQLVGVPVRDRPRLAGCAPFRGFERLARLTGRRRVRLLQRVSDRPRVAVDGVVRAARLQRRVKGAVGNELTQRLLLPPVTSRYR